MLPPFDSMSLDPDTQASTATPHLPFGEAGLPDDLFRPAPPGGCCSGSPSPSPTFQIVTAFGIPLRQGFLARRSLPHVDLLALAALALAAGRRQGRAGDAVKRRDVRDGWLARAFAWPRSSCSWRASPAACRARCCAPCMSASSACSAAACWRSLAAEPRRLKASAGGRSAASAFLAGLYHWAVLLRPRAARRRSDRRRTSSSASSRSSTLVRARLARARAGAADRGRDLPRLLPVRPSTCRRRSIIAATISSRWSSTWCSAPRASTARRPLVSATYIFLFILFGSFMEQAGVIRFFNEMSMAALRRHARRAGQGLRRLLGADGHGLRLRRRQRRRLRPVHHPADEALRLPRRLRRRRRGDLVDGRADHAAGDGRRRLHHGRDDRRALCGDRRRRRSSRRCSISPPASGRCIWKPASAGCTACRASELPSVVGGAAANWYLILPLVALVYLLFAGFTPLFAGAVGAGADGRDDPRRWRSRSASASRRCASSSGSGWRCSAPGRSGRASRWSLLIVAALVVPALLHRPRARDADRLPRGARRRRAAGAAGRPRLRAGRHRHRHHDADRARHHHRQRAGLGSARTTCRSRWC